MRKKLFAILMSAMMMVTFMPAMAFADTAHSYQWKGATATNVVEIIKAATCTEAGKAIVKCTAGDTAVDHLCKATKEVDIPATEHTWSATKVEVTPDDIYNAYISQFNYTKANAYAKKVAAQNTLKGKCYLEAEVCTVCGALKENKDKHSEATAISFSAVDHASNTPATTCEDATCTKCGALVAAATGHDYTNAITRTVKKADGHSDETFEYCVKCGYAHHTGWVKTAGSEVHHFGTPISAEDWAKLDATAQKNYIKVWTGKFKQGTILTPVYTHGAKCPNDHFDKGNHKKDKKDAFNCDQIDGVWYQNVKLIKWESTTDETSEKIYVYYPVNASYYDGTSSYGVVKCADCGWYMTLSSEQIGDAVELASDAAKTTALATNDHVCAANYEWVAFDALCTEPAYEQQICKVCGAVGSKRYTDSKKGHHTYEVVKTDATCESASSIAIYCSVCDAKHKTNFLNGFNQKASSNTNCVKANDVWYFVGVEGELKGSDMIQIPTQKIALGHKYGTAAEKFADATCELPEIWARKCTVCGKFDLHNHVEKKGLALGHTAKTVVVAPTCEKAGFSYNYCEACGQVQKTNKAWEKATADVGTVAFVNAYGFDKTNALGGKCDFTGAWKTVKAATIFEEGTKAVTCAKCGAVDLSTKAVVAKLTYAAPKVSVKKGKVVVTVAAQDGAVKYVVKAGKKTKTVTAAGKVTLKKVAKKGKKVKVTVTAYNAAGAKVVSKAKTVKAK